MPYCRVHSSNRASASRPEEGLMAAAAAAKSDASIGRTACAGVVAMAGPSCRSGTMAASLQSAARSLPL